MRTSVRLRRSLALVGANPGRRDGWPPYASVRFVLVRRARYQLPGRGLVTGWRRSRRGGWEAKVVFVVDDPGRVQATITLHVDWVPTDRLVPIFADPNEQPARTRRADPADQDY